MLISSQGILGYGLFNNCPKLETVKFGKYVTSIQNGAFYECPKLEKIIIEKGSGLTVPDNKWGISNVEIIKEE